MHKGDDMKVIHVNFSTASVDPVYFPQLEVIGILPIFWQITEGIHVKEEWNYPFFDKVKKAFDESCRRCR